MNFRPVLAALLLVFVGSLAFPKGKLANNPRFEIEMEKKVDTDFVCDDRNMSIREELEEKATQGCRGKRAVLINRQVNALRKEYTPNRVDCAIRASYECQSK